MPTSADIVLTGRLVRSALEQAWRESNPGLAGGHEEGGFIVRDADGGLVVIRWQQGSQFGILVPPHVGCRINGLGIAATFHTHPNTGPDAMQEPSETDRLAVRDDLDLKGMDYLGEFVISDETIYLITPSGHIRPLGGRRLLLEE